MFALLPAASLLAATLGAANPWSVSFHEIKVKEVYAGSVASPNAHYVMLQMYAAGQNLVSGKQVRVYDDAGILTSTFTFPGNVPVGMDQSTILIATFEARVFFGGAGSMQADLPMTAVLPILGGKVCFHDPGGLGDIDCVAWGGYTGSLAGVGTPANAPVGLEGGRALLRRMDVCGSSTVLDACDDTENNANDFLVASPAPRNNLGTDGITPLWSCGNSVVQSIEQCDDGNTSPGDGCQEICRREPAAFAAQTLVVDPAATALSDGNGVFELGEQVEMRPSWRNTATAPLTLTGALSAFTGPAGHMYVRVDGAASYGTLAPGAATGCATAGDCYTLDLSPGPRPLVHWDAAASEVNVNYGFQTWAVHIGESFVDVPRANPFYRFVETLLHHGVTGGCTATAYCPDASTTRDAMAVFVLVSKGPAGFVPPPCGATPMFTDVPVTSGFCRWVEELERRGVVSGCAPGLYCPSAPATREQMAVFVLRTLDPALTPPACVAGSETFADVPATNGFCRWIEELARRGVVTGCGGGNYCPAAPVTREQMGVFLSVTFGLTLYGV